MHSSKYRPDIDGLRAIAVMAVIIFHAFPQIIPGGFVGVDIFFVISGYLISKILIDELKSGRYSILTFYDRRIRRIFPALLLVLTISLVFGYFFLFKTEFQSIVKHAIASTTFLQNFMLWSESGYFDKSSNLKPLLHIWSLAIEEQFYIFWPIIINIFWRKRINLAWVFLILGGLSFASNTLNAQSDPAAAYYSPFGRFWELMLGGSLAYAMSKRQNLFSAFGNLNSIAGSILILTALFIINPDRKFPGFWALLPTLGAFLIISSGKDAYINKYILSSRPFVWIGLISYPLYLWHWPILSYAHIASGHLSFSTLVALLMLTFLLAILTFRFVEPIFRKASQSRPKFIGLIFAMGLLLSTSTAILLMGISPRLNYIDIPHTTEWDFLRNSNAEFNSNGDGIYRFHDERNHSTLFIGDSQLAQYAERIATSVEKTENKPGAVFYIGGGCIPIPNTYTENVKRSGCWKLREEAYRAALDKKFDRIVIGGSWNWYFFEKMYFFRSGTNDVELPNSDGRKYALRELEATINKLREAGKTVFLLLGNPINAGFDHFSIETRLSENHEFHKNDNDVEIGSKQFELHFELTNLAERAGAIVIDPLPAFCHARKCKTLSSEGIPVFKDSSHFNPEWANKYATFIDSTID